MKAFMGMENHKTSAIYGNKNYSFIVGFEECTTQFDHLSRWSVNQTHTLFEIDFQSLRKREKYL